MKTALIITYYWPPSGGAGVQRWLKFSKYLPQYGWEPLILTVDPEYAAYPVKDPSLEKDIPAGTKVYRTKATDWFRIYAKDKSKIPSAGFSVNSDNSLRGKISRFIRGNFFIPDPRRGWNRHAFRKACEIINNHEIRHIITTSPPHSTQLIGLRLKKKFPHLIWISDMRDTWTDIYYYKLFYPTAISIAIDTSYEKKVITRADRIITVGNNLADTFASKVPGSEARISVIPNGYDEDDFTGIETGAPDRFTITYIGTISESYPVDPLLNALRKVGESGHDFLLRFVGNVPDELISGIRASLPAGRTEFVPYCKHSEAISLMASSSLLVLIIPSTERDKAITPGKVFEYIATGRPVLYIGPADGDAAFHLKKCGQTGIFDGRDENKISTFISDLIKTGKPSVKMSHPEYSRRSLTEKLCSILEKQ